MLLHLCRDRVAISVGSLSRPNMKNLCASDLVSRLNEFALQSLATLVAMSWLNRERC